MCVVLFIHTVWFDLSNLLTLIKRLVCTFTSSQLNICPLKFVSLLIYFSDLYPVFPLFGSSYKYISALVSRCRLLSLLDYPHSAKNSREKSFGFSDCPWSHFFSKLTRNGQRSASSYSSIVICKRELSFSWRAYCGLGAGSILVVGLPLGPSHWQGMMGRSRISRFRLGNS